MTIRRIAVLASGGDAPGMNTAIRAVVRAGLAQGWQVLGVRGGYAGLFRAALAPMNERSVANILQQGGSILGSGRCPRFLQPAARHEAASLLRRKGVDALVVIGGDGSYAGAAALHADTGMRVVGIPGSIDNDVGGTEASIGFDTAVNTALEAIDRIRDTAFAHERTFYVEVMGRQSGHIAAAVGLAGGAEAVLVPEIPTDIAALAARIDRSIERGKLASILVVAEGVDIGGAAEVAAAVEARLQHRHSARVVVLGHIQRGGRPTARDRILAARLGTLAIEALAAGQDPCVVGVLGGCATVTPLADAIATRPKLDPSLLEAADLLSGNVAVSATV